MIDFQVSLTVSCGVTLDTVQVTSGEEYDFGMFHLTKDRYYVPIDFYSLLTKGSVKDLKVSIILYSIRYIPRLLLGCQKKVC